MTVVMLMTVMNTNSDSTNTYQPDDHCWCQVNNSYSNLKQAKLVTTA